MIKIKNKNDFQTAIDNVSFDNNGNLKKFITEDTNKEYTLYDLIEEGFTGIYMSYKYNNSNGEYTVIKEKYYGYANNNKKPGNAIQANTGIASVCYPNSKAIALYDDSISVSNYWESTAITLNDESISITKDSSSKAYSEGDSSISIVTADDSEAVVRGKNSVAIAIGEDSYASGILGSWLVLTEMEDEEIINMKSVKVDGKIIKEHTKYTLSKGQIIEVK